MMVLYCFTYSTNHYIKDSPPTPTPNLSPTTLPHTTTATFMIVYLSVLFKFMIIIFRFLWQNTSINPRAALSILKNSSSISAKTQSASYHFALPAFDFIQKSIDLNKLMDNSKSKYIFIQYP